MVETKYKAMRDALRDEILSEKYRSGMPFPSVRALIRRFGHSAITVRHALDELANEGLIRRTRGRGTYVSAHATARKIGLFVPGVAYSEFFPPLVDEVSRLARENGYALCLGNVTAKDASVRAQQARETVAGFIAAGVSGVLYQPIEFVRDALRLNADLAAEMTDAGIALVLIDRDIVPSPARSGYDLVGVNNFQAGVLLARHLMETGARRICYLHGEGYAPLGDRYEGAKAALANAGRKVREMLLPDVSRERSLLSSLSRLRPDAVICGNDHLAAMLLQLLAKKGRRVPEDVRVTGFDDVRLASLVSPPLTTIRQPIESIAATAFDRLVRRMGDADSPPVEINLPATLVVRASTQKRDEKTVS